MMRACGMATSVQMDDRGRELTRIESWSLAEPGAPGSPKFRAGRYGGMRALLEFLFAAVLLLAFLATLSPSAHQPTLYSQVNAHVRSNPTPPSYCNAFTASLTVKSPEPALGPAGTHLTLQGSGFFAPAQTTLIEFWLQTYSGTNLLTIGDVPSGTPEPFTTTVTMPGVGTSGGLALGTYYIWALSVNATTNCAFAPFTLTAIDPPDLACENWNPELNVTSPIPEIGPAGTSVNLTGSGFYDNNVTQIYWTQAATAATYTLLGTVTSSATGGFNLTVDVPSGFTPGNYTFWGWENTTMYPCGGAMWNLTSGPSLVLTPNYGPGETNVTVTGAGFNASDTGIRVTGNVLLLPLPCALSDGSISVGCYFIVSGGVAGPHTISAVGNVVGGPTDTGTATFTVFPTIFVSPSSGDIGSSFTISGIGFSAGPAAADVTFDGQLLTPTGGSDCGAGDTDTLITPDALGGFNCNFTVPSWATLGPNSVQGDDTNTSELTGVETFVLASGPSITLSQFQGPAGTSVNVTGAGFNESDTEVEISGGALLVFAFNCTLSNGSIAGGCNFVVSGGLAGAHVISGVGNVVGGLSDTATATFVVVPSLILSPANGSVGTSFTVTGLDFSAGPAAADVSFDSLLLTPTGGSDCGAGSTDTLITPDAFGEFVCTFTVPSWATPAWNDVQGDDTSTGEVTSATPFIVPGIVITSSPTTGQWGTPVTVTGYGWIVGDTVELGVEEVGQSHVGGLVICSGSTSGYATVNSSAEFACSFGFPAANPGAYSVIAVDASLPTDLQVYVFSTNDFTVVSDLLITSVPTMGPVGTPVVVTGNGWTPGDSVQLGVAQDGHSGVGSIVSCSGISSGYPSVNGTGGFICEFGFPIVSPGSYSVVAVDPTVSASLLTYSTNSFVVTLPSVTAVSSTSGTPGPVTFSVNGLAPDTVYYVYLDTTKGVASSASYNPLGTCAASASGSMTCTVTIPTGLPQGHYYVDLFQDPTPPPYIFSVFNFTVPASGASHPLLSTLDYEIIAGVIVIAVIGAAVLVSRRRHRKSSPPPPNTSSVEQRPAQPRD